MRVLLIFIVSALNFIYSSAYTQKLIKGITIPNTYWYDFTSKINNRQYHITIALPPDYTPNDTHYSVLYPLDGRAVYNMRRTYDLLNLFGEYPKIIMVGIDGQIEKFPGNQVFRFSNYTPTHSAGEDSAIKKQLNIKVTSGGASSFLRVIKEDVMSFISKTYKLSEDRTLAGGSASGLYELYILFEDPQLFSRYIIGSPMIDWDSYWIIKREAEFFKSGQKISGKLFMSVGALEDTNMVKGIQQIADVIKSRNYPGLQLKEQVFEDETHLSVSPAASGRGLRYIYSTVSDNKK